MSENTIRIQTRLRNAGSGRGFFARIEKWLGVEVYLHQGFPVHVLPKVVFVAALGIFYISNSHRVERLTRIISERQVEVEDLRADYITAKSELMYASKQSEVLKKVRPIGLTESMTPPFKIVLKEK
jgi:hypothetical protein